MADPVTLTIASMAVSAVGGFQQSRAIKAAGKAQLQQAEFQNESAKVAAGQARASAQRQAIEDRRRGTLAESRARAVAASGGGQVSDVANLIGDLNAESKYAAFTSLYEGETQARDLQNRGALALYEGESANRAAKMESKAKMFETLGSMGKTAYDGGLFDKYKPETWSNGDPFRTR
jgi:hypothetical protein